MSRPSLRITSGPTPKWPKEWRGRVELDIRLEYDEGAGGIRIKVDISPDEAETFARMFESAAIMARKDIVIKASKGIKK